MASIRSKLLTNVHLVAVEISVVPERKVQLRESAEVNRSKRGLRITHTLIHPQSPPGSDFDSMTEDGQLPNGAVIKAAHPLVDKRLTLCKLGCRLKRTILLDTKVRSFLPGKFVNRRLRTLHPSSGVQRYRRPSAVSPIHLSSRTSRTF